MAWPAILAAGITATNSLIGSAQSAQQNKEMQQRQLKWEKEKFGMETELANTAHQREIADLQAAGLNPVLSAGGQGSATPQAGSIGALPDQSGQILSTGMTSAAQQLLVGKEIEAKVNQMEHQNDLYDAEKLKALAESDLVNEKRLETVANTALLKSQRDLVDEQWNKAIHETQLAYYQVQQAYEELQYIKENAKNKAEILAAENKLKTAEANMKHKEDKLWYFSYIWDKGMDVGKIVGAVIGLGKFAKMMGLGADTIPAAFKGLPGITTSAKSTFGYDKITGTYI